jgi:hypothetical protein
MKKRERLRPRPISELARWRTTVIYGPSGAGKSTLAATGPKPYFMDSNKGLSVLLKRSGFDHLRGNDFTSMKTLDLLLKHFRGQVKPDFSKLFETCIFDHFDDIQTHILEQLGLKGAKRDSRRDPDLLEQRDWGKMANQLRRYIRNFKSIPVHKILICSEREDSEGLLRPGLQGQLKDQLPYFADDVLYLDRKHRLWFDSTDVFYAKSRAWWLKPGGPIRRAKKGQRFLQVEWNNLHTLELLYERIVATQKRHKTA